MTSYPAFLLGDGPAAWQEFFTVVAWVTGLLGLTMAWIAAASYVGPARRALADGRTGRTGQPGRTGQGGPAAGGDIAPHTTTSTRTGGHRR